MSESEFHTNLHWLEYYSTSDNSFICGFVSFVKSEYKLDDVIKVITDLAWDLQLNLVEKPQL